MKAEASRRKKRLPVETHPRSAASAGLSTLGDVIHALAKKEQSEILYKVTLAVRLTEAALGRVAGGWVNLT